MVNEAAHFEDVSVEHGLLHLVEFISADSVKVMTVELLLQHPGVDVLVKVTSNTDKVVS